MSKIYDLRSDTITKPSKEMRDAMYKAECGDDVYQEDKTVLVLQEKAATITGKEKALYVSSGTMGNLITLMILGGNAKFVITDRNSHIVHYELCGMSRLANLMPMTIDVEDGILTKELVEKELSIEGPYHMPKTALVEIENTHNRAGGRVYPIETLKSLYNFVNSKKVHLHMDGARIFNASTYLKTSVENITKYSDSITFCLSKGLGAPIGSLLCGSASFISEAIIIRKLIGGGLRQSGIVAAAGIYALDNNIPHLEEDHINAKKIANAINSSSIGKVDATKVETNIVIADTNKKASEVADILKNKSILTSVFGDYKLRFTTHRDISSSEVDEVCNIIKTI